MLLFTLPFFYMISKKNINVFGVPHLQSYTCFGGIKYNPFFWIHPKFILEVIIFENIYLMPKKSPTAPFAPQRARRGTCDSPRAMSTSTAASPTEGMPTPRARYARLSWAENVVGVQGYPPSKHPPPCGRSAEVGMGCPDPPSPPSRDCRGRTPHGGSPPRPPGTGGGRGPPPSCPGLATPPCPQGGRDGGPAQLGGGVPPPTPEPPHPSPCLYQGAKRGGDVKLAQLSSLLPAYSETLHFVLHSRKSQTPPIQGPGSLDQDRFIPIRDPPRALSLAEGF